MADDPRKTVTDDSGKVRRRAIIRLALGQFQIVGATITLYFLLTTGESRFTIWAAIITAAISVTSVCMFKLRKKT